MIVAVMSNETGGELSAIRQLAWWEWVTAPGGIRTFAFRIPGEFDRLNRHSDRLEKGVTNHILMFVAASAVDQRNKFMAFH
jgi:hypothetical protein